MTHGSRGREGHREATQSQDSAYTGALAVFGAKPPETTFLTPQPFAFRRRLTRAACHAESLVVETAIGVVAPAILCGGGALIVIVAPAF